MAECSGMYTKLCQKACHMVGGESSNPGLGSANWMKGIELKALTMTYRVMKAVRRVPWQGRNSAVTVAS